MTCPSTIYHSHTRGGRRQETGGNAMKHEYRIDDHVGEFAWMGGGHAPWSDDEYYHSDEGSKKYLPPALKDSSIALAMLRGYEVRHIVIIRTAPSGFFPSLSYTVLQPQRQDFALDLIRRASRREHFNVNQLVCLEGEDGLKDHSNNPLEETEFHLCFVAARMGQANLLRALISEHKADWQLIRWNGHDGHSAVCAAVWSGSVETLEVMVQGIAARRGRTAKPAEYCSREYCCAHCGPIFVEVCKHGSVAQLRHLILTCGVNPGVAQCALLRLRQPRVAQI